jgi:hypothetical protein
VCPVVGFILDSDFWNSGFWGPGAGAPMQMRYEVPSPFGRRSG